MESKPPTGSEPYIKAAHGFPLQAEAEAPTVDAAVDFQAESDRSYVWNLLVLAAHNILHRLAWIFKTETVLMPVFLDVIAGPGWVRGMLPVLNRLGQSLPPLLASPGLRNARYKGRWLIVSSFCMAACFGVLAWLCIDLGTVPRPWFPAVFLLLYLVFFSASGVNQISFNTLQGKLIPVARRGRLMALGGVGGSVISITVAYLLLARWLELPADQSYVRVFGFTATVFSVAAFVLFLLREPASVVGHQKTHLGRLLAEAGRTLRDKPDLRCATVVAMLFMCIMLLFPHFQWLGRNALGASGADLMWWVLIQNGAVGVLSTITGNCADRYGYRIVLRYQIFATAAIPLVAIGLAFGLSAQSRIWYSVTYLLLGLIPVTTKALANYVLELAEEHQHPQYLSTLSLGMALPLLFSPAIGWLIDWNLPLVFVAITLLIFIGGGLTFWMAEPRHET